jgi:hypothetical protein
MTATKRMTLGLGLRPRTASISKFSDKTLNVLWAGQSNAAKMSTSFSGAGNAAFKAVLDNYFPTVNSINGATDGAAIHKAADSGYGYYWDLAAGTPGPACTAALTAIDNAGINRKAVDVIVIVHGERDSYAIESATITADQSKAALLGYINYLRAELGNPLILLTPIGADRISSAFSGWGQMRKAIWQLWNEYPSFIHENPGFWDLAYDDNTHLAQAGYEAFGERTARRILGLLGKIPVAGTLGPSISGVTFSPSTDRVYITIAHDAGTDITITERRGNSVSINGAAYINVPSSVVYINATSYQINPATNLLNGDTLTFSWPWGTLVGHTPANCLKDNATNPMPLRPSFDIPVTQV